MMNKVMSCTLVRISVPFRFLHTSSIKCKEKKMFYNQFIKEYKPRVYSGFVEPLIEKTEKKWIYNVTEGEEPNYEEVILNEARRRRRIYQRQRMAREFKREQPNVNIFTSDQLQHIQFLRTEDPELWTAKHLASSFGVDYDTMRAALRHKIPPQTDASNEDSEADRRRKVSLLEDPINARSLLPSTEVTQPILPAKDEAIYENPWFQSFAQKEDERLMEVFSKEEMEELIEEEAEEDEHFELFCEENDLDMEEDDYDSEDDTDSKEDDKLNATNNVNNEAHEEFKVQSNDNNYFYDNEGRFLFKLL